MTLFEDLKNKYPIKKLPFYGDCIIIPKEEFGEGNVKKQAELELALKKDGYMLHFVDVGDPDNKMKFALQLRKADVYTKEPFPETPKKIEPMKEIVQHRARGGNNWKNVWSIEEDQLLISLWNQKPKLIVHEIAIELQKQHPNRTELAICNRVSALQVEGQVQRRMGRNAPKAKPDVEGDRAGFSRIAQAEEEQEKAASTALINKDIEQLGKITDALLKITEPINQRISQLEAENIHLRQELSRTNENLSVFEVTKLGAIDRTIGEIQLGLGQYMEKFDNHEHSTKTGLPLVPP